jgi:DNA-binding MarR family transcriptional regulator
VKRPDHQDFVDMLYEVLHAIYLFERQEMDSFGLSYPEILALKILSRSDGLAVGELARRMGSPLFTATRLANRLAGAGLAARTVAGHDRRSRLLSVTEAGRLMVARIDHHAVSLLERNTADLPPEEMWQLNGLARRFGQFLGVSERLNPP